jgi:acetamidase/formamidase
VIGPIYVEGAEPGMTLEIRVDEIRPGNWGWNVAGGWAHAINERLGLLEGPGFRLGWSLDAAKATGTNQFGQMVGLSPFLGVMGMPADEDGIQSTIPPRVTGGNLDCKELVAGTSLFLPVAVSGGLFSTGDGHARQGDGEVSVTAIECPMELVRLTFTLHREMRIPGPRVRTAGAWMTLGLDSDLHEASMKALEAMMDLMGELHGLERSHALALASVVVDMRVTQLANQVLGVHAVLADDAITFPG